MPFTLLFMFFVGNFLHTFAQSANQFTVGGITYTLDEDKCSNDCLQMMTDQAENLFPNSTLSTFSLEELKIFCPKVYLPNKKCLDKCPLNNTALAIRLMLEYECGDYFEGFINDSPCIANVMSLHTGSCSLCRDTETKFVENDDAANYAKTCRKAICYMKCLSPYIDSKCGEKGVKFFNFLTTMAFKMTNKSAMIIAGQPYEWPKECKPLAEEDGKI